MRKHGDWCLNHSLFWWPLNVYLIPTSTFMSIALILLGTVNLRNCQPLPYLMDRRYSSVFPSTLSNYLYWLQVLTKIHTPDLIMPPVYSNFFSSVFCTLSVFCCICILLIYSLIFCLFLTLWIHIVSHCKSVSQSDSPFFLLLWKFRSVCVWSLVGIKQSMYVQWKERTDEHWKVPDCLDLNWVRFVFSEFCCT